MVTEDFFRDLERARLKALVEGDIAAARGLHAPDYQLITPGAATLSSDDYLGGIESGELDYVTFEPASDIAVRIFETGAAVRYQARIEIRVNGDLGRGTFWHTDLYELRDGRWQAVWSQATRIPQQ
jgi:hypothetical protein